MKRQLLIILSLFEALVAFAQGEIDTQEKIFYRDERTFGFLLNSNGYGLNFRYGKRIDAFRKTLYEIELDYLKHPKEIKATIQSSSSSSSLVFGKVNTVFALKSALGFQKEMFQKKDFGGISIRYFIDGGPSIAFLKPIYYRYQDYNTGDIFYETFPQFDVYLIGKAPFTKGFKDISVSPGLFAKFGFTFEYSKVDQSFHALEAGIGFDAYLLPIEIMYAPQEKILFVLPDDHFILTLFISYRFGKVIDTQFNFKRNRFDKLISE